MSEIKKRLEKILEEIVSDATLLSRSDLFDGGVLDSLDIVTLITEISDEFDVVVTAEEILPENFNSVDAMAAMIERLDKV